MTIDTEAPITTIKRKRGIGKHISELNVNFNNWIMPVNKLHLSQKNNKLILKKIKLYNINNISLYPISIIKIEIILCNHKPLHFYSTVSIKFKSNFKTFIYIEWFHSLSLICIITFHFWSPESQVISDELHDGGGIFVLVLFDLVNISNGIIESLFGNWAGFGWVILDFIEEDGVVKG